MGGQQTKENETQPVQWCCQREYVEDIETKTSEKISSHAVGEALKEDLIQPVGSINELKSTVTTGQISDGVITPQQTSGTRIPMAVVFDPQKVVSHQFTFKHHVLHKNIIKKTGRESTRFIVQECLWGLFAVIACALGPDGNDHVSPQHFYGIYATFFFSVVFDSIGFVLIKSFELSVIKGNRWPSCVIPGTFLCGYYQHGKQLVKKGDGKTQVMKLLWSLLSFILTGNVSLYTVQLFYIFSVILFVGWFLPRFKLMLPILIWEIRKRKDWFALCLKTKEGSKTKEEPKRIKPPGLYRIRRERLVNFSKIPRHDEVFEFLEEGPADVFISHRWVLSFPDVRGEKLQAILKVLREGESVWIDYCCVPQNSDTVDMETVNMIPEIIGKCGRMHVLGEILGDEPLRAMMESAISEESFQKYTGRYMDRLWCFLEFSLGFNKIDNLDFEMMESFTLVGAQLTQLRLRNQCLDPKDEKLTRLVQAYSSDDYATVIPLLENQLHLNQVQGLRHRIQVDNTAESQNPEETKKDKTYITPKSWHKSWHAAAISFLALATMHRECREKEDVNNSNPQSLLVGNKILRLPTKWIGGGSFASVVGITLSDPFQGFWDFEELLRLNSVFPFLTLGIDEAPGLEQIFGPLCLTIDPESQQWRMIWDTEEIQQTVVEGLFREL